MYLQVNGHRTYCYTGGKPFDAARPTVVFVHGVVNDHSVWGLQSRYLANHGWNVLAVDLPGHCRSEGDAPSSVEEAARFIAAVLDAAGVARAALVGHSWGSLIALEAASQLKERVTHLALVGTAYPLKVSAALLDTSLSNPAKALQMINVFSRSTLAAPPSSLMHRGFQACDNYANGEAAIAAITCPVLFVLGAQDQMTPANGAQSLITIARERGKQVKVVSLPVGHHQMTETPDQTLAAIQDLLKQ